VLAQEPLGASATKAAAEVVAGAASIIETTAKSRVQRLIFETVAP
jgi:hypothetical protein